MNVSYSDEKVLIDGIVKGEEQAIRTFLERFKRLVSHIVFRMIDNPEDREDICQDVFVKCFSNIGRFKFKSQLSSWIGRIAYNSCVNHHRKHKTALFNDLNSEEHPLDMAVDEGMSPVRYVEEQDLSNNLENAICRLPYHYRMVITLYHLDDMSYDQIGEILDMPEGTVKSYLFRGRKKLKEILMNTYELEDIKI